MEVYWFDDRPEGGCRTPRTWRVLVDDGAGFRPVAPFEPPACARDRFDRVLFPPVRALAVKVEVELRRGPSAGILELRLVRAD